MDLFASILQLIGCGKLLDLNKVLFSFYIKLRIILIFLCFIIIIIVFPSIKDCEDYGQAVIYKGTVPGAPHSFTLDGHHTMDTGRVFPVCANTYSMLKKTRLNKHFSFLGIEDHMSKEAVHFGIYADCGKGIPFKSSKEEGTKKDCSKGGCC